MWAQDVDSFTVFTVPSVGMEVLDEPGMLLIGGPDGLVFGKYEIIISFLSNSRRSISMLEESMTANRAYDSRLRNPLRVIVTLTLYITSHEILGRQAANEGGKGVSDMPLILQ